MRVSLTNFSGTAASTVAVGSLLECAGSLYSFTDTAITLAAATASASVAVYFVAIPAAGGTTCTVVMDSTAPVWVDARQGFYASAASVSRAIGGCWIHSAASFYSKFLYIGEYLDYCLRSGNTRPLLRKVIPMGEWNMDATAQLNIAHDIPITAPALQRIISYGAAVRDDTGRVYSVPYNVQGGTSGAYIDDCYTDISVIRITGGFFDGVAFDGTASTIANRGWVWIEWIA